MKQRNQLYIASLALLLLTMQACVTQKYKDAGSIDIATSYRGVNNADTATIANLPATTLFSDPDLQILIKESIQNNLDLKMAMERMKSAEANLRLTKTAFLPSLNLDLSAQHGKQSNNLLGLPPSSEVKGETFKAQLSTAWEIDIWGKLGSAKRSAIASFLQSDAAKRAIQTQLISLVVTNYYQLIALDQQLKITQETLKKRVESVETIKALKEAGIVNGAAVVQSEANRYAAEVSIPDLKRSIHEVENSINILLGRNFGEISRSTLSKQVAYKQLTTGIPSQLLVNRPDVQQAELAFRVAFENTNLARTYFYPQLTLTANGGNTSLQLKNLFDNSIFYNVVAGLTQPIFNKGLNKARLTTAKAIQQEAYFNFQKTMLTANAEVSNALYAYQSAGEKETSRTKQIIALEKAVDYTKELLKYSSATNYTDVLTSEQSLLNAQLGAVNDQLQKLQSVVNLYRALGGGWKE